MVRLHHIDAFCRWRCSDCAFGIWKPETVAEISCPYNVFHSWCWLLLCVVSPGFAVGCADVHSLCTWSRRGCSDMVIGTVTCINCIQHITGIIHRSTMTHRRYRHSKQHAGACNGLRLCPGGLSTMTVSLLWFSCVFICSKWWSAAQIPSATPFTVSRGVIAERAILWLWWSVLVFYLKARNLLYKSIVLLNLMRI